MQQTEPTSRGPQVWFSILTEQVSLGLQSQGLGFKDVVPDSDSGSAIYSFCDLGHVN